MRKLIAVFSLLALFVVAEVADAAHRRSRGRLFHRGGGHGLLHRGAGCSSGACR